MSSIHIYIQLIHVFTKMSTPKGYTTVGAKRFFTSFTCMSAHEVGWEKEQKGQDVSSHHNGLTV